MKNLARRLSLCQYLCWPATSERPGYPIQTQVLFLRHCERLRHADCGTQGSQLLFPILEDSVPERSALY